MDSAHRMEKSDGNSPASASEVTHFHNVPTNEGPVALSVPDEDQCPDGGYGWVCVVAVFIICAFTWGVLAVRFTIFKKSKC